MRNQKPRLFAFQKGKNEMNSNEYKIVMLNSPETPKDPPEPVKCSLFEKCEGCKYPAHGFVCWNQDGSCLRSAVAEKNGGDATC